MRVVANLTDIELLDGLRQDREDVFEQLFNRYWEKLHQQAYLRLRNQEEAEDMVQDIFADVWKRRHTLEIKTSLAGYLQAALKYKIIRQAAKANLQRRTQELLLSQMEELEDAVIDLLAVGELNQTIAAAIQRFPENMRKVFLMRTEAFTVAEIADALKLSKQTVKNNTSDALRRLRVVLAEKHPEIPPSFYLVLTLFIGH